MNMHKRPKVRFDRAAAEAQLRQRFDAAETAFFARELEQIAAKTYDIKYAELKSLRFLPVDTAIDPGVEQFTYRQFELYGTAKIVADYANDFPNANAVGREFIAKVKSLGAGYSYSIQEMRAAAFAQRPLDQLKASAARKAIMQLHDSIARDGDSANGLTGFLGLSNTTTFAVPNGAAGTATWATKTPDEIVADLNGIANGIVSSTKEIEVPDTILLPISQFTYISSRRMGDGDSTTILKHFLTSNPYIKTVESWYALTGAGSGGADRMVCYRKDPDAISYKAPVVFEQFAPELEGMAYKIACHGRSGGVICPYPLSVSYGDGI